MLLTLRALWASSLARLERGRTIAVADMRSLYRFLVGFD
jgi:hypothetical protein